MDLFREEFFVALGQSLDWSQDDAQQFWRDYSLYEKLSSKDSRANGRQAARGNASGPFVDRTAMLLDPSLMDQARRAAGKFQLELNAAADGVLRKVFSRRLPGCCAKVDFEVAFVKAGELAARRSDPTGNGGVLPGFGDQREIELLVEAGFTPVEAIHIATENGALYLGQQDRIGTLALGKQADLVLIKGDPSKNIDEIEHVETVFV